jgi:ABC-type transport system involved in multi-copper enzyme maturation permease subunit
MINVFRAELLKLRRRRVVIATGIGALAFAAVASIAVFLSASGAGGSGPAPTLQALGGAGGATEAFSIGAAFTGILVLVLFIANVSSEFSQGTFRTLLMREPRRAGMLAGKLAALLVFAAAVLLLVEVLVVGISTVIAPTQDVSTAAWFTLDGLGEAAGAYATAVLGVTAWASFGVAIAMLVRSAPIALAIGIAWSGPFEHLVGDVWTSANQWFPGLLLEAFAVGGTDDVAYSRALLVLAVYAVAALAAAALVFARRDVTA